MLKPLVVAGALVATAFAAHSATYDIGVLPVAPDTFAKSLTVAVGGGSFSDTFTFTAPHGGGYAGIGAVTEMYVAAFPTIDILTIKLYDASHTLLATGSESADHAGLESSSLTWSLQSGARYSFEVWGFSEYPVRSQYTFVAGASLVPEPQALAMMLAGLVGVGFMARRRRLE